MWIPGAPVYEVKSLTHAGSESIPPRHSNVASISPTRTVVSRKPLTIPPMPAHSATIGIETRVTMVRVVLRGISSRAECGFGCDRGIDRHAWSGALTKEAVDRV